MESADLTGAVLDGRYRVIEPIAEGAMGVVYRAERLKLGRIVAIKVLHDELPAELASRKRFEIEAMAMAKLEHPHCAAVVDVGVHGDKPFVVMDFVSGQNLKDVIADGPLPRERAVEIVRQVLSGVAHAHDLGIIHRDIKPANIVLSQKAGLGDHVKILDFGLARLTADNAASGITTGIVVGTPSYMAPEQIRGIAIDHRTDLYACGVLLFELLTGRKPFISEKDDPIEVCSMHLKNSPPTLKEAQPGLDLEILESIVARALSKKADDRYATAVEFSMALEIVPTRRMQTAPVVAQTGPAPVVASDSGWSVPADAKSSMFPGDGNAPTSEPVSNRSVPIAGAIPSAPESGPTAVPSSAPTTPPAPVKGPIVSPTTGPTVTPVSGPTVSRVDGPTVSPVGGPMVSQVGGPTVSPVGPPIVASLGAPVSGPTGIPTSPISGPITAPMGPATGPTTAPIGSAMTTPAVGGLPADFDLSRMIPSSPTGASDKGLSPGFDLSLAIPQAPTEAPLERSAPIAPPVVPPSDQPTMAMPDTKATFAFLGAPPTGPSPLAATDAPAAAEPVQLPAPPSSQLPLTTKQLKMIGAGVIGLIVLIAIIVAASRCGGSSPSSTPGDAALVTATPDASGPITGGKAADEQEQRIKALLASGKQDEALELVLANRRVFPNDARFAYIAGKIHFERKMWALGLTEFREVLKLDPTYRSDPAMIKLVVRAFVSPAEYPADIGAFLTKDIGPPAREHLQRAADRHPNPKMRERAKAEIAKIR